MAARPVLSFVNAAILGLAGTALAEDGNPHNTKLCLVCHKETPRFGIDQKENVTFRTGVWDDPKLCATCHNPHLAEVEGHKLRYGSWLQFCSGCHRY